MQQTPEKTKANPRHFETMYKYKLALLTFHAKAVMQICSVKIEP